MVETSHIFEQIVRPIATANRTPAFGREQAFMLEETALKKKVPQRPMGGQNKHLFIGLPHQACAGDQSR
jgi:hypothetical protein